MSANMQQISNSESADHAVLFAGMVLTLPDETLLYGLMNQKLVTHKYGYIDKIYRRVTILNIVLRLRRPRSLSCPLANLIRNLKRPEVQVLMGLLSLYYAQNIVGYPSLDQDRILRVRPSVDQLLLSLQYFDSV